MRVIALPLVLCLAGNLPLALAQDAEGSPPCKPLAETLMIERVWGGTRVGFGAQESKKFIYIGYYDANGLLTVSQINKCTGMINTIRLPSRFGGWDSHNTIALALDSVGRLHVAGNMHVTPLLYARMDEEDDVASLATLRSMLAVEENRTTYPNFFHFPDGALGFSYRSGESGNGKEIINRFDGERWVRWTDQPLFAPESAKQTVNAYHTGFVAGPDGFFHIAWVWRENYKVETNFHVNYARSQDLKNWQNSSGRTISLPITPAKAEVVDPVPKGSGLFNNIKLGFDATGRPVISYLKFDSRGYSQLFHARPEKGAWRTIQSTDWTFRWDPRGGGTISSEISFSGVEARDGHLLERVRQPEIGNATLKYAADSLRADAVLKSYEWDSAPKVKRKGVPGAVTNVQVLRQANGRPSQRQAISWLSHPADNRDKPRDCAPTGLDCNFVSELFLHTSPSSSSVGH